MQPLKPNKLGVSPYKPDEKSDSLSRREQFNVVVIGLLLFLVLGALFAIFFLLGNFSPLAEFSQCLSESEYGRAVQIGLLGLAYTVGLPIGMSLGLIIVVQGLRRCRTSLTEWVLLELDEQKVKERYSSQAAEKSLASKKPGKQPAKPNGKYWLPFAATLCGLCLFGGGVYFLGRVDPGWQVALLTGGAALAALGIRTISLNWLSHHGDTWIPTWLGLIILVTLFAAPVWYVSLVAFVIWIREHIP